jgi:hypothetical protein
MTAVDTYRRPVSPIILLLALLAVAGAAVAVRASPHALQKHGEDAAMIHRCLDDNGPSEIWRSASWRTPNKYFQVCQIGPDRWGFRIIEWLERRGVWKERTSFSPGDGSYRALLEHLTAKAFRVPGLPG